MGGDHALFRLQIHYLACLVSALTLSTSPFAYANGFFLLTKQGINLNGGDFDSFDSGDPNFSASSQYYAPLAKDGCNIGSIATNLAPSITLANGARIAGHLAKRPGCTYMFSPNSAVGSKAWITAGLFGIQPGFLYFDLNLVIPAVQFPDTPLVSVRAGSLEGTLYNYLLLQNGNYGMSSLTLDSGKKMGVFGQVSLLVGGDINISGTGYIYIAPGASLTCYLGGTTSLGGLGITNASRLAASCILLGLPTCTNITYTGTTFLVAAVYAPEASLNISGTFTGQAVASSATINSAGAACHYDEAIARLNTIPQPYSAVATTLGSPMVSSVGKQVQFPVAGGSGLPCTVEASTDRVNWIPLMTNMCPFVFTDRYASNFPQRYYRCISRP